MTTNVLATNSRKRLRSEVRDNGRGVFNRLIETVSLKENGA